jgi:D-xylose transport system ATP-binding protein
MSETTPPLPTAQSTPAQSTPAHKPGRDPSQCLVALRNIKKAFGGVHAVDDVSLNLYPGEVVAVLGHNGAGKSTLMKMLAGAYPIDSGEVIIAGNKVNVRTPADAQALGIESIYQTLALADNLDSVANLFLGRELLTKWRTLDDHRMDADARKVFQRLNKNFTNVRTPVRRLSGGQRQVVAISRAIYFNARILIMDEPTAALGPQETAMVGDLVRQLKAEGVGIFLISHDMHDVFALSDRLAVMKNGKLVGTYRTQDVTEDEVLGMIIVGKQPTGKTESPRPMNTA